MTRPWLHSAIFWLAIPWLLPQALWLRKHAPRFAAASGESQGSVGSGPELQLLALGDSIIAGVGAASTQNALIAQFAAQLSARLGRRVHWHADGIIGSDCQATAARFAASNAVPAPDLIVISTGVNDTTSLHRLGRWRADLNALLLTCRQRFPGARLILIGLPPMGKFPLLPQPLRALLGLRAAQLDREARIWASKHRMLHVPVRFSGDPSQFSGDGFHPSEAGYRLFAEQLVDALLADQSRCPEARPEAY